MALNRDNFIIDRYVKGNGYLPATGERIYSLDQVKDGNLKVTVENSVDVVDAIGNKIETLERGRSAEFSASNALFSFTLMGEQLGAATTEATDSAAINMPKWEEFTLAGTETDVTLKEIPVGTAGAEIPFIYVVPKAGGVSKQFKIAAEAGADAFKLEAATKKLTLPIGLAAGDKVCVDYEYACKKGFKMTSSAIDKVREHKAVFLVLGHDACDKNTQYAAYQVFPKAKLSPEIDLTFTPDMDHPFTLQCAQDYCDPQKRLFEILVDENGYVG